MWVAVTIAALGFLAVAVATQLFGYRLGGTVTVPVLAVYTLKDGLMLPVFLVSTVVGYVGLGLLKRYSLIYGRDELVAAILSGTIVPVAVLLALSEGAGYDFRAVVFVGSILPGLAAYNVHQLKPEFRRADLLATVGLFAALVGLGWALVTPALGRAYGGLTPPLLYASTADVAVWKGAVVGTPPEPVALPKLAVVGVLTAGLGLGELLRSRFDIRVGVITAALLAIFALENAWFLALYALVYVVALGLMEAINLVTLRYGRVLLGAGTAVVLVLTLPLAVAMPIERGLTAFFTVVIAGVGAYNAHATAPRENRLVLPLQVAVFVPALLAVRSVAPAAPRGIPQALSPTVVLVGGAVVAACLAYAVRHTVRQPDEETVLSGSVLSGGDGT